MNMRARPMLTVATILIGLVGGGCGKLAGIDDYHGNAAPAGDAASTAMFVNPTCGACVAAGCTEQLDSCQKNATCGPWERCMAQCMPGDGACEYTCTAAVNPTNGTMGDIAACTFQHCYDECQATGPWSSFSAACGPAYRKSCEMPARACAGDEGCREFTRCMFEDNCLASSGAATSPDGTSSGINPACTWQCEDRVQAYEPVDAGADAGLAPNPTMATFLCAFFNIGAACGLGRLDCVDGYGWVSTSAQTVAVTAFVHSGNYAELPGAVMPGVQVRPCRQEVFDCTADYETQTTDVNGRAPFNLATDASGHTWYFEVTPGWPNSPSKLLFNTGRRLSEDTFLSLGIGAASALASNVLWSKDLGALYIWMRGCDNFLAPGLKIRLDADAGAVSISYLTASAGTSSPTFSASTYLASVYSVEPGVRTVSAYNKDGQPVAEEKVVVKADAITYMEWLEPLRAPGAGQ